MTKGTSGAEESLDSEYLAIALTGLAVTLETLSDVAFGDRHDLAKSTMELAFALRRHAKDIARTDRDAAVEIARASTRLVATLCELVGQVGSPTTH